MMAKLAQSKPALPKECFPAGGGEGCGRRFDDLAWKQLHRVYIFS
jgi:hypothetical protein